jgi:hypothetical protein
MKAKFLFIFLSLCFISCNSQSSKSSESSEKMKSLYGKWVLGENNNLFCVCSKDSVSPEFNLNNSEEFFNNLPNKENIFLCFLNAERFMISLKLPPDITTFKDVRKDTDKDYRLHHLVEQYTCKLLFPQEIEGELIFSDNNLLGFVFTENIEAIVRYLASPNIQKFRLKSSAKVLFGTAFEFKPPINYTISIEPIPQELLSQSGLTI